MRMPQKSGRRWITAAIAWMVILTGGYTSSVLAQSTSPPGNASVPNPEEALYDGTQRSAATQLLAAMGPNTPTDTKVARLIDRLVLRDHEQVHAAVTTPPPPAY